MKSKMELWFLLLGCYLLGSIPWAYIVSWRMRRVDIRRLGDGNVGARNAYRQVGRGVGIAAAILDSAKGMVALSLARGLGIAEPWAYVAGAATVLGHDFPLFLHFQGGQGLSTTIGISLFFLPRETIVSLAIVALVFWRFRHWDLSFTLGLASLPLIAWWRGQSPWLIFYMALLLSSVGIKKLVDRPRAQSITPPV